MNFVKACIQAACLSMMLVSCFPEHPRPVYSTASSTNPPSVPTTLSVLVQRTPSLQNPDNLKDVEKEAGFDIQIPNGLPKNYAFKSAMYIPEQQAIAVQYVWDNPAFSGEMLFFTKQRTDPIASLGKAAEVQEVQTGSLSAKFVQGGTFDGKWEKDAPVYRLTFQANDFYYTILFNGNEESSLGFITKDEIIALANQFR